ncbi:MAG: RnfABCDGE type electron transport complex subunit B [Gammaproteobacteria bacterium]
MTLAERIDACLPQTQCRRCGYAGCLPYAQALAEERASIDSCPPGGEQTRRELARLLGHPAPATPVHVIEPLQVARVEEGDCIGCTKCIQACPVDAIVGAAGLLHGVVAAWCTGCALCVPVCPTDCIILEAATGQRDDAPGRAARARQARARFEARRARDQVAERGEGGADYVDLSACSVDELAATVRAAVRRRRGDNDGQAAPRARARP